MTTVDESAATAPADDLAAPVRAGASQLAASKGMQLVLRMGTSLALARVLEPRDFGLLGLVGVLMVFLQRTIAEGGTSNALVQREHVSGRLASSVFWFNLAIGGAITGAIVGTAPWLATVLGDPDAEQVLRGLAATFVFAAMVKVPQAMLRRRMRFGAIAGLGLINALLTGVVALPLAIAGHGVMSMVIGQVVATIVEAVITFAIAGWRPTAGFHRDEMRSVTTYARNLTAFNVVAYVTDAGDKFIVGRWVGTAALGIYNLPYRLLFAPVAALSQVVREVLFPLFSRRQHDVDAMARDFLRTISAMSLVTFPVCAITAALGSPLVDAVLGPKWHEAGPILSVMAVVALEQAVLSTGSVILTARGRTDVLLRWGLAAGLVNLVGYVIGVHWGVMGVAVGFLVTTTVLAYPAMALPFREIQLPVRRLVEVLLPVAAATAVLAAAAVGARMAVEQAHGSDLVVLAVGGVAGAVGYALVLAFLRPPAVADVITSLRRRRNR